MDLVGEYRVPASRDVVWAGLNDADILRSCIPGCQSLEQVSETEMTATVVSKIGPVKATFKGAVTLENIVAPESYTIVGEGKGGVAGFAKGSADVSLEEDGAETILRYSAKAQVGGKLAQLGSRLIDSTARKMADEFFGTFAATVGEPDAGQVAEAERLAIEDLPGEAAKVVQEAEHAVEERLHAAEEQVEAAAARGTFGGPLVWGLIALGAVIVVLALMS
jgi:carbon monoxide dehydrogenase subunit G